MLKPYCYAGGKIRPTKAVALPPNDLAVLRGYAVFDFLKTVPTPNGRASKPFLWPEHWRRFQHSAQLVGLKIPVGEREAKKIIAELIVKNKIKQAAGLRLLLTGGASPDGFTVVRPAFYIFLEDLHHYPKNIYQTGAKVITAEHERFLPAAKITNYLEALRLQSRKQKTGAVEILYVSRGQILECSTSNFFIVKNKKLITPKAGVLPGVTRNLVIKLAKQERIGVEERAVKTGELKTTDECFLTATTKDIMPVTKVDDFKISDGKVGEMTKRLMKILNQKILRGGENFLTGN